jgi:hypothetical protein
VDIWHYLFSQGRDPYSVAVDWVFESTDFDELVQDAARLWPACTEHLGDELSDAIMSDLLFRIRNTVVIRALRLGVDDSICSVMQIGRLRDDILFLEGLIQPLLGDDRVALYCQYDALDTLVELQEARERIVIRLIYALTAYCKQF